MRQPAIRASRISAEEAARRQKTQEWIVNSRLEGIEPTKEALALIELYNKGHISLEEYGRRVKVKYAHFKRNKN